MINYTMIKMTMINYTTISRHWLIRQLLTEQWLTRQWLTRQWLTRQWLTRQSYAKQPAIANRTEQHWYHFFNNHEMQELLLLLKGNRNVCQTGNSQPEHRCILWKYVIILQSTAVLPPQALHPAVDKINTSLQLPTYLEFALEDIITQNLFCFFSSIWNYYDNRLLIWGSRHNEGKLNINERLSSLI